MKIHIPLVEKKDSADIADNFLIQEGKVFIMDNHRLALWSWLQEIDLHQKYNLIHIDAHPDMSTTSLSDYSKQNHPVEKMELATYRTFLQAKFNIPLFRWDNYLKIFTELYSEQFDVDASISFTHHLGSKEGFKNDRESIFLLRDLDNIFNQRHYINENKWIFNLDLDYFFTSQPHKKLLFSEEFILELAKAIKIGLENDMIAVVTIAFSPECCGSWENAEFVYGILNQVLGLKFNPTR